MPIPVPTHLHVLLPLVAGRSTPEDLPPAPEGRELARAWTLLDEEGLRRDGPMQRQNAFMEDEIHDWRIRRGQLLYFSRLKDVGEKAVVVLDYETDQERRARLASQVAPRPPGR